MLDRRQRQRRKGRNRKEAEDARSIHDVSDDLIWRILLRLDSPIWLIRAACACKRWRRVVTNGADEGRSFLRLASSLHPPTVVGQYHNYTGLVTADPANRFVTTVYNRFVPSSSPAAAPIDGCHFAVDHLRFKNSSWHVTDCHGGLVLLRRIHRMSFETTSVPNLIVYDPLTHNHRKIYSPPPPHKQLDGADIRDAFLLDGDDGNISILNFRVFYRCFMGVGAHPGACVFSTAKGGNWHFLNDGFTYCCWHVAGHVGRSLYMGVISGFVATLDNTSLVFSKVALPIRPDMLKIPKSSSTFTVVHSAGVGPASPPRASIVHVRGEQVELFRRVNDSGEWMLEHIIPNLSERTATCDLLSLPGEKDSLDRYMSMNWIMMKKIGIVWSTMASSVNADGAPLALLSARRSDCSDNNVDCRWFFSIDVNTMELQVLPELPYCRNTRSIFTYSLPWPQFLGACVSSSSPASSSQDGRVDEADKDHQVATGPRRGTRNRKPSGKSAQAGVSI